eukprot:TRINITY_DN6171_c0_g2_i3.p1 TRINITY_DN6171_c0_g2~~TRINITY_DN6171_c0_g2_i3.p1  ORF type:complete len:100 (-),score=16.16 TRINITY_DN6171_c0_g2_i3:53-352(-)
MSYAHGGRRGRDDGSLRCWWRWCSLPVEEEGTTARGHERDEEQRDWRGGCLLDGSVQGVARWRGGDGAAPSFRCEREWTRSACEGVTFFDFAHVWPLVP